MPDTDFWKDLSAVTRGFSYSCCQEEIFDQGPIFGMSEDEALNKSEAIKADILEWPLKCVYQNVIIQ